MGEKMWLMFTVSFCLVGLSLFPLLSSFLQAPGVSVYISVMGGRCVWDEEITKSVCLSNVLCMALMRMKWD